MQSAMPARRFPPPWSVEEQDACFVVIDHSGQKLAYIYFETDTKMMRRPLIAKPPATMKPTALPGPIIRAVYLGIGPSSWRTNSEGVSPKSWKAKAPARWDQGRAKTPLQPQRRLVD
jgi:hypothetical protein